MRKALNIIINNTTRRELSAYRDVCLVTAFHTLTSQSRRKAILEAGWCMAALIGYRLADWPFGIGGMVSREWHHHGRSVSGVQAIALLQKQCPNLVIAVKTRWRFGELRAAVYVDNTVIDKQFRGRYCTLSVPASLLSVKLGGVCRVSLQLVPTDIGDPCLPQGCVLVNTTSNAGSNG